MPDICRASHLCSRTIRLGDCRRTVQSRSFLLLPNYWRGLWLPKPALRHERNLVPSVQSACRPYHSCATAELKAAFRLPVSNWPFCLAKDDVFRHSSIWPLLLTVLMMRFSLSAWIYLLVFAMHHFVGSSLSWRMAWYLCPAFCRQKVRFS